LATSVSTIMGAFGRPKIGACPFMRLLNPSLLLTPKTLCILGRRISASMSRTFWLMSASAAARLLETVVLPSDGLPLQKAMT